MVMVKKEEIKEAGRTEGVSILAGWEGFVDQVASDNV